MLLPGDMSPESLKMALDSLMTSMRGAEPPVPSRPAPKGKPTPKRKAKPKK